MGGAGNKNFTRHKYPVEGGFKRVDFTIGFSGFFPFGPQGASPRASVKGGIFCRTAIVYDGYILRLTNLGKPSLPVFRRLNVTVLFPIITASHQRGAG